MGPGWTRTYSNDDTGTAYSSMLYDATATFHLTCHNEVSAKSADELEEAAREIERLENMMRESGMHEDSKYARQYMELHHARLAPMKHKKPHMNRKVIR